MRLFLCGFEWPHRPGAWGSSHQKPTFWNRWCSEAGWDTQQPQKRLDAHLCWMRLNFWHRLQFIGLGMCGRTDTLSYLTWLEAGTVGTSNAKKVSRRNGLSSLFPINLLAFETNWSARADRISSSDMPWRESVLTTSERSWAICVSRVGQDKTTQGHLLSTEPPLFCHFAPPPLMFHSSVVMRS
jgi:hypothetical protein